MPFSADGFNKYQERNKKLDDANTHQEKQITPLENINNSAQERATSANIIEMNSKVYPIIRQKDDTKNRKPNNCFRKNRTFFRKSS